MHLQHHDRQGPTPGPLQARPARARHPAALGAAAPLKATYLRLPPYLIKEQRGDAKKTVDKSGRHCLCPCAIFKCSCPPDKVCHGIVIYTKRLRNYAPLELAGLSLFARGPRGNCPVCPQAAHRTDLRAGERLVQSPRHQHSSRRPLVPRERMPGAQGA